MKKVKFLLIALVISLFSAGQAVAMSIVDLDLTDLNIITKVIEDDNNNKLWVYEDYNERFLIPYPSHDGLGIVNSKLGYFDKVVTFTADDLDGPWNLDFLVHNSGPYCWSDYHFEFWDATFTNRLTNFPLTGWSDQIFTNESFDGSILQFWEPSWQCVSVTNDYMLTIDPRLVNNDQPGSFGIRQVATVPEPCTLLLLGSGLAGIIGSARKRLIKKA